jgi:hypothetical protein
MTNKELQMLLQQHADDMEVAIIDCYDDSEDAPAIDIDSVGEETVLREESREPVKIIGLLVNTKYL